MFICFFLISDPPKLYSSAVYRTAGQTGVLVNGRIAFKAMFICTFAIDNVIGAFPHWSNILAADDLSSTGFPYPTPQAAEQFRQRQLKNQLDWNGSVDSVVMINEALGDDSPSLTAVVIFLVQHNLLTYKTCVGWGKGSRPQPVGFVSRC